MHWFYKGLLLTLVSLSGGVVAEPPQHSAAQEIDESSILSRRIESSVVLTGHLARSHSRDLLIQPASALRNLLFYTTSAVTGLVKDTALDLLLVPGLEDQSSRIGEASGSVPGSLPGMDLASWELELDRISDRSSSSGRVELLVDGDAFYPRLQSEIEAAETSIRIRTYIFDNDDVALGIADQLKARSEDIDVEVMFDGIGTWGGALVDSPSLPESHTGPVSMARYLREGSEIDLGVLGNTWLMGDHSKMFLFDDSLAFLGGMNIGREYRYDWHDLMLELRGPVVADLSADAQRASIKRRWGDLSFLRSVNRPEIEAGPDDVSLRLLYTDPHDAEIYRAQLAAIKRSRRYIYVENAYPSDDQFLFELIRARERGVDVRLIVPIRPDNELMNRSNTLALNLLAEHGVRVYLYPGMTHVKAAIYDGWVCLGTANYDKLSFKVNREVNLASSDPDVARSVLEQVFERDFAVSTELTAAQPVKLADHVVERIVDVLL